MRWSVSLRTVVQPLGLSLDLCFHSSYFTTFFTTHDSYFAFYAPGPFNCGHGSFCVYPCLVTLWNIHCLAFCSFDFIGYCAVMYILKSIWFSNNLSTSRKDEVANSGIFNTSLTTSRSLKFSVKRTSYSSYLSKLRKSPYFSVLWDCVDWLLNAVQAWIFMYLHIYMLWIENDSYNFKHFLQTLLN